MGRWSVFFLALVGGFFSSTPVKAEEAGDTVVLQPSTPWVLDFADSGCRLNRYFGPPEYRHLLYFETSTPTDNPTLMVGGPSIKFLQPKQPVVVGFGDEWSPEKRQILWGEIKDIGSSFQLWTSFPNEAEKNGSSEKAKSDETLGIERIDLEATAKITQLTLSQAKSRIVLETGGMKQAFEALNQCSQDLIRHWGLNLEQHKAYSDRPSLRDNDRIVRGLIRTVLKEVEDSDFAAVYALTFIVEKDGTTSNCILHRKSLTDLDFKKACDYMKRRARFEPARDMTGSAMRSYYTTMLSHRPH
ncbi:hypothetical protein P7228_06715 [Altererythrobacter arenosus]|uniref:TonB C-terminal domain-containing protein n=1 Tax=Altererythrobacter arenosus TaxID=3032592 RepID=A0ABY8FUS0_9SPHN|nr:hypothetical protein [Altererythrobacter sp. CAU 1644]WFL78750.1 hypothetical protein P7228_06715 [Altererythrobacter sp. CAU 1644]